jgi:hypothetical protein
MAKMERYCGVICAGNGMKRIMYMIGTQEGNCLDSNVSYDHASSCFVWQPILTCIYDPRSFHAPS